MNSQDSRDGWIPQAEYDLIQAKVPILCVDLLPLHASRDAVGLIRRETYDGEEGWCMIGGAVKRDERLLSALTRHVRSTLGDRFVFELVSSDPLTVIEYFSDPTIGEFYDPRKHAVALSYAATCSGVPQPRDEARDFRWFSRADMESISFGFGQGAAIHRLLDSLD